jgi:hypothetical protein
MKGPEESPQGTISYKASQEGNQINTAQQIPLSGNINATVARRLYIKAQNLAEQDLSSLFSLNVGKLRVYSSHHLDR